MSVNFPATPVSDPIEVQSPDTFSYEAQKERDHQVRQSEIQECIDTFEEYLGDSEVVGFKSDKHLIEVYKLESEECVTYDGRQATRDEIWLSIYNNPESGSDNVTYISPNESNTDTFVSRANPSHVRTSRFRAGVHLVFAFGYNSSEESPSQILNQELVFEDEYALLSKDLFPLVKEAIDATDEVYEPVEAKGYDEELDIEGERFVLTDFGELTQPVDTFWQCEPAKVVLAKALADRGAVEIVEHTDMEGDFGLAYAHEDLAEDIEPLLDIVRASFRELGFNDTSLLVNSLVEQYFQEHSDRLSKLIELEEQRIQDVFLSVFENGEDG